MLLIQKLSLWNLTWLQTLTWMPVYLYLVTYCHCAEKFSLRFESSIPWSTEYFTDTNTIEGWVTGYTIKSSISWWCEVTPTQLQNSWCNLHNYEDSSSNAEVSLTSVIDYVLGNLISMPQHTSFSVQCCTIRLLSPIRLLVGNDACVQVFYKLLS